MIWLLLIIGFITYYVVRTSVANLTRTPIWLLWLVMMIPAFVWTSWAIARPDDQVPLELMIMAFLGSSTLYWILVQKGRIPPSQSAQAAHQSAQASASAASALPTPAPRSIDREEEANLQNCFPWSVFYLQNIEHRPQALICRGQLRTSPEVAYKTVRENVEAQFRDRFLVVFQEGLNGKPFFALVPNPYKQAEIAFGKAGDHPVVALALLFATLLTTTLAGFLIGKPDPQLPMSLAELQTGLPYSISLLSILGMHELGHYWVARRYGIRASLPYFIPVPPARIFPIGTFGAFIQHQSPIPHRKALFDIGLTGPLVGLLVTVPILLWGLSQSTPVPINDQSGLLNVTSFKSSESLLLTLLSWLALGDRMAVDSALNLHPVAIAGCLGLILTALNLMPVGQLDGGHIVHAMLGQRAGAAIGQVARLLLIGLAIVQQEVLLWVWAVLLFLMPVVDEPVLNDVSELNNVRDFLGILALGLLLIIILPAPAPLLQVLF